MIGDGEFTKEKEKCYLNNHLIRQLVRQPNYTQKCKFWHKN